ncbi:hypothetical protein G3N56_18675 [Desulfovibrio sulfodismutans]|uniref:Uncharacterized protein n=1 Tax=Desulfolutivibrio sulfodismutans TaxID=63561 RepID=A0A7K3NSI5_9BACT|nr:hypothetical protein [Desulfolutivibrio sulfodismutans]NDY58765.1 hypothetical protein [Desulfolutivibrio sulfodismutans]QLA11784.1 hypothetical protein GD606_05655 [Desulfolutivibrio sulfodismutans DSM 3696]
MSDWFGWLTNREFALLVYLLILLVSIFICKRTRGPALDVIRAFFSRPIQIIIVLMICYIFIIVYFLYIIGFLSSENLKTTIIWMLTFSFSSLFSLVSDKKYIFNYKNELVKSLGLLAIVVFVSEMYNFSLGIEFIVVLCSVFFSIVIAFGEHDVAYQKAVKFSKIVLGVVALIVLGNSIVCFIDDRTSDLRGAVVEFLVPVWLTFLYFPFLYLIFLYIVYERVFMQLKIKMDDKKLILYAVVVSALKYKNDIKSLEKWVNLMMQSHVNNRDDVEKLFDKISVLNANERNPPYVSPDLGWSPYKAKYFLDEYGLATGSYNKIDEEWYSDANVSVDNTDGMNNLAYYIEGDEYVARVLKLILNVGCVAGREESESLFYEVATALLEKVFDRKSINIDEVFLDSCDYSGVVSGKSVTLKRSNWLHCSGYDIKLSIFASANS